MKRGRPSASTLPFFGWAALAVMGGAAACAAPESTSSLEVIPGASASAPPLEVRAKWRYRSSKVDIDAALTTTIDDTACSTTGLLVVDQALSSPSRYTLPPVTCDVLRVTETGDIVLYEQPSGHDWSQEQLQVDTDREVLTLGPWVSSGPSIEFQLSAPDCGPCTCPQLVRREDGAESLLLLAQDCD